MLQGTHRLVRQSPFSSANTRHTSFAAVDVMPILGAPAQLHVCGCQLRRVPLPGPACDHGKPGCRDMRFAAGSCLPRCLVCCTVQHKLLMSAVQTSQSPA